MEARHHALPDVEVDPTSFRSSPGAVERICDGNSKFRIEN